MTVLWSFHCDACGRCCNSPPQASLPELLHHASRFIGALGVRRLRFDTADAAQQALATRLLQPGIDAGEWIELATLAVDSPTATRCPALLADGRCALHADRKPQACSVVPLDPLLADTRQHAVLARRSTGGAEYLGAACIRAGQPAGFAPHADATGVVDARAQAALTARRHALEQDKRWWGDAVFAQLCAGGLGQHLPADGLLVLPLAPVLRHLAGHSVALHTASLRYLQAQHDTIARALENRPAAPAAQESAHRLRRFQALNQQLLLGLRAPAFTGAEATRRERHALAWLATPAPTASAQRVTFFPPRPALRAGLRRSAPEATS